MEKNLDGKSILKRHCKLFNKLVRSPKFRWFNNCEKQNLEMTSEKFGKLFPWRKSQKHWCHFLGTENALRAFLQMALNEERCIRKVYCFAKCTWKKYFTQCAVKSCVVWLKNWTEIETDGFPFFGFSHFLVFSSKRPFFAFI